MQERRLQYLIVYPVQILIHLGATSIMPFVQLYLFFIHMSFFIGISLLGSSLPWKSESTCRTIRQEFREWHLQASVGYGRAMKRRARSRREWHNQASVGHGKEDEKRGPLSKLKWPHFLNLFSCLVVSGSSEKIIGISSYFILFSLTSTATPIGKCSNQPWPTHYAMGGVTWVLCRDAVADASNNHLWNLLCRHTAQ